LPGRKHLRIWPIAAATAGEERVKAVGEEFLPAMHKPYAWLEIRLEHACESGCLRAYG